MTQFITYATSSDLPLETSIDSVSLHSRGLFMVPSGGAPSHDHIPGAGVRLNLLHLRQYASFSLPHQIPTEQICSCPLLSETAGPCKASPGHCPPSGCRPLNMLPRGQLSQHSSAAQGNVSFPPPMLIY
ncbi:hypothetical protein NQZ68_007068 [Dissostichus eleginoides]|nr:hypothetical protein NQZ68_007068 [Dissostichus eleginoides]